MTFASLPELKVEIAFNSDPLGADPSITGDWIDVSSDVRNVSFQRGRNDDLGKVNAGNAEIILSNANRYYDPLETDGPFYGFLKPRRGVRISAYYPNNSFLEQKCKDSVSDTFFTPAYNDFSDEGLRVANFVSSDSYVRTNILEAGHTVAELMVHVGTEFGVNWSTVGSMALGMIDGLLKFQIETGTVRVRDSANTSIAQATLPAAVLSSNESIWLKATFDSSTSSARISYALSQTQIPSTWTDITTSSAVGVYSNTAKTTYKVLSSSFTPTTTGILKRVVVANQTNIVLDLVMMTLHVLFRGFNSGWRQGYGKDGKDAIAILSCFDALGLIGGMKMPSDLVGEVLAPLNPWGYWKLGDTGDTSIDYGANQNDLTLGTRVMTAEQLASGLQGGSSLFGFTPPGVVGVATIDPYPNIYSGSIAPITTTKTWLSFWVNTTQTIGATYASVLFACQDLTLNAGAGHFLVRMITGGIVTVSCWNGSAWVTGGTSTSRIDNGLEHHVAVSYTSSTCSIYIDGVLESTTFPTASLGGYIHIAGGDVPVALTSTVLTKENIYFVGKMQDFVYHNNDILTLASNYKIYEAGYGSIDESSSSRVARILDAASIPTWLRNIDSTTYAICGATEYTEDQAILEAIQKVEDTEQGLFFVDRQGRFAFHNRYYLSTVDTGINVQASFDDEGTNIGYRDLQFTYDADQLVNDHLVSNDLGEEYQYSDQTSITDYGRRSRTIETLLNETASARDMAIGLTNIYKEPIMRAEPFEIVPLGIQWLDALPLDLGMRLNLKSTPTAAGTQIDQDLALQSISYDMSPKKWKVTLIGSPRPVVSYFILGDSAPIAVQRTNLVTNPSFETDLAGANGTAATSTRASGNWIGFGSWVHQTVATSTGAYGPIYGPFSVNPNFSYAASVSGINFSGTARSHQIGLQWRDSGGGIISSVTSSSVALTNVGSRLTIVGDAPSNAASVYITVYSTTTGVVGDISQWDCLMLEQSSAVGTYFDGSNNPYTYGTPTTTSWNGTAHASSSKSVYTSRRINLVKNPSFELSTSRWFVSGSSSVLSRTTSYANVGTASAQIVRPTSISGSPSFATLIPDNPPDYAIVNGGVVYTATCYVRAIVGSPQLYLTTQYFNQGGGPVIETGATPVLVTNSWQRISHTTTAPPLGYTARSMIRENVAALQPAATWLVDGVMFEEGSAVQPYFDGSVSEPLSGYLVYNQLWTIAVHDSVSYQEKATVNTVGSLLDGPDVLGF